MYLKHLLGGRLTLLWEAGVHAATQARVLAPLEFTFTWEGRVARQLKAPTGNKMVLNVKINTAV